MKKILLHVICKICLFLLLASPVLAQDKLLPILENELTREMTALKKADVPPYLISYRVDDSRNYQIEASLGVIIKSSDTRKRILTTQVRVGNPSLDNTHELRGEFDYSYYYNSEVNLPVEDNPDAINQVLWNETDKKFTKAITDFSKVQANVAVKVAEEDKSADLSVEKSEVYIEPIPDSSLLVFNKDEWEKKLTECSELFLSDTLIYKGNVSLNFEILRKYFINTEGTKIAQNLTYARIMVYAEVKADDGMELPLYLSYFAFKPADLPDQKIIMDDIMKLIANLKKLRTAQLVEPYTGPAILSGASAGVFFHEIFGHRIEGHRQKSEYEGQTFKKKVGQPVLNEKLSVYFEPALRNYDSFDLNGYYLYDDEGIKGKRVDVIQNGILKDFLMSRSPIEGFPHSNGHGRAEASEKPVSRQSNLIITTSKSYTSKELRNMLIEECKKQNLPYGFYFDVVQGGFTLTGRFMPNAFNVLPLLVYKVYTDGRPDEIVRGVDLVGTPLAMFSQINAAGGKSGLFTGYCGAESGSVPVSSVSPELFVKQIELQKKVKSQERPFILPRPDKKGSL
jgi:TldD protein